MSEKPFETFGIWEWARKDPNRQAVIEGDRVTTFGELAGRTNQLARALRALGIEAGGTVAVVLKNKTAFYEIDLAVGQIGAYLVCLNWHLTVPEMMYIIEDSQATVLIADDEFAQILNAEADSLPADRFATSGSVDGWKSYEELGGELPTTDIDNRLNGALMLYTSGTTGRPKGVQKALKKESPEEGQLAFTPLFSRIGLAVSDGRHLVCSPLYHAAPAGWSVGALHFGQTVVIHDVFKPELVLEAIEKHKITSVHLVPTHFHRMLQLPEEERLKYDLSSLHFLVHAGASCPPEIKKAMFEWVGPIIWEYLASTEGTVSVCSPEDYFARPKSVGKPLAAENVRIIRADGEVAGPGEEGTIYFKPVPDFVYRNDADKTEANRLDGFATVGDIGMVDENGYVFLLDRRVDLIVSGGVNIYPAEIEAALITHEAVQDIGVIGRNDEEWGKRVVAMIQLVDGVHESDEVRKSIIAHAEEHLPSYKRPREYYFLDEFPRSEAGKVKRKDLRDIFLNA